MNIQPFLKHRGHLAKAIARDRPRVQQAWYAGECGLDRKRHQPFHVLHRIGRLDDIDLHLIIRDVRHRIDRQPRERHRPHQRQHQRGHHHQHAVAN